jgi:glycosyltransferase involved in cell wall biosynthesis
MYKRNRVAVVVPAYNEEWFVGTVIETVPEFVDRVYPVDDASTDGTWAEICEAARPEASPTVAGAPVGDGGPTRTRTIPIRHERNRGVGAAITTGYERARRDGADVVAVMAGDGQMDPGQLDRLLDPVVEGRADYAKGNRLLGDDHRDGMPKHRTVGNVALTLLTRISTGYWRLMDPQNGYTVISREAIERIDFDRLYSDYGFANDLLVELNVRGFRVADVAMPAVYGNETSHICYRSFVPRVSWVLARGFVRRLRADAGESFGGDRSAAAGERSRGFVAGSAFGFALAALATTGVERVVNDPAFLAVVASLCVLAFLAVDWVRNAGSVVRVG